jgi:hypothetical protein
VRAEGWRRTAVAALLLSSGTAWADPCPAPGWASDGLASVDAVPRLRFLHRTLGTQGHRARLWTTSWTLVSTAVAAGSFTWAAITDDAADRTDQIVTGSVSVVSALALIVMPLEVMADQRQLAARLARGSRGCPLVRWAEDALVRDAASEALGAGWLGQLLAVGVNVGAGLVLGLGLGHWRGGVSLAVGGVLLGELQILTQPTGAVDALARYRAWQ